jgi:hypothetical protein
MTDELLSGRSEQPTDDRAAARSPPPIRMPRRDTGRSFRRTAAATALLGAVLGVVVGTLVSVAVGSAGTSVLGVHGGAGADQVPLPAAAAEPDLEGEPLDRSAARAELRRAAFERAMRDPPEPRRATPRKPRPRIHVPLSEVNWVRGGAQPTGPEPSPEPDRGRR